MTFHLNTNKPPFWRWLTSELSERMAQNLPFIKITPKHILCLGSFEKSTQQLFKQTYPLVNLSSDQETKSGIEHAVNKLNPFKKNKMTYFDIDQNVQSERFDLIWSGPIKRNIDTFPHFFSQAGQHLKVNGLIMFNYLGPDTAKEYRSLVTQSGWLGPDMHDIGDLLTKSGFADPVMNMEYLTLEYEDTELLTKDLVELGLLAEQDLFSAPFRELLTDIHQVNGKLNLTVEIVYGHAWKVPKREPGVTRISPAEILKTYKK
jgi:malonyl-CoA O-methyltransferase